MPPKTEVTKTLTRAERLRGSLFMDAMLAIEHDILTHVTARGAVPKGWHEIAMEPSPKKSKINLRLDDDVLKFFRGLGRGYQTRINRVRRAFMEGRLSKMVEGPDTLDWVSKAEEYVASGAVRPKMGTIAGHMAEMDAVASEIRMTGEIEMMRALVEEFDKNGGV